MATSTIDPAEAERETPTPAMPRVLLISMPFATTMRPSIGLGLLKAGLARRGMPCDVRYCNLRYADRIGVETYERISNFSRDPLLGEWIFAEDVFGAAVPEPERYFESVLRPCLERPFHRDRSEADLPPPEELFAALVRLRRQATQFLDECEASIPWPNYGLVGFTTTFEQNLASLALSRRIKSRHPEIAIAFGGANCEGEMGAALHRLFPFIDFVCFGEGDDLLPALADRVLAGDAVEAMPGLIRRVDGETAVSDASAPVLDMDVLPIPDYDDYVRQWRERAAGGPATPQILIETARGCWWGQKSHCTFCGLNGSTIAFRAKSPERALAELRTLAERYETKRIAAVDNIIDLRYFRELLPRLKELELEIDLFYETKANLKKEQVQILAQAGISQIQPGIESLNSNLLRLMRKGVSAMQNIQLLRWCSECLVWPAWNLLLGFPDENPDDYARQAEIVPLLTHLPPPTYLTPVRLDRFSPLFVDAERFGLRNVRATQAHRFVYPFADGDLDRLAYYFDFEFGDGREPESYTRALRREVERWQQANPRPILASLGDGDALTIWDTRPIAVAAAHHLTGLARVVCETLDRAHAPRELLPLVRANWRPDVDSAQLEATLRDLQERRLLLFEDGRFLSLAVAVEFQARYLADHLIAGRALPDHARALLAPLYEAQPDAIRSAVARCLADAADAASVEAAAARV